MQAKEKEMFETVTIAGVECLAKFENNEEFLHLSLAIATKDDGIQELPCVIPHGFKPLRLDEDRVPPEYKDATIETLTKWILEGRLIPTDWRPKNLYYFDSLGYGYANFWQADQCVPIGNVSLLNEYCQHCSIANILSQSSPGWLSDPEKAEFGKRAQHWKHTNQPYLEQKSRDFAQFWCDSVGALGTNGDPMADMLHALARMDDPTPKTTDLEKLFKAIYDYAIARFDAGRIPFLTTDYGIGRELRHVLSDAGLMHMAGIFPWKTLLHLNFDDCDRSALFEEWRDGRL